jgi:hypothetical protein
MPNWCYNQLIILGDEENLLQFYQQNKNDEKNEELDFLKSVPQPEEITSSNNNLSSNEVLTTPNWYNWNISNLGTKWNVKDADYIKNQNNITYKFDTAWSPPIPWVEKVSVKYPEIIFQLDYIEEDCGFAGLIEFENGVINQHIDKDPETVFFNEYKNEIIEIINDFINNNEDINISNLDKNDNEKLFDEINKKIGDNLGDYISDEKIETLLRSIIKKLNNPEEP